MPTSLLSQHENSILKSHFVELLSYSVCENVSFSSASNMLRTLFRRDEDLKADFIPERSKCALHRNTSITSLATYDPLTFI